jgi:cysteinyl-tRNA synthetase
MAMATLGKEIDVHTGGIDHIPVHHNAEIAQSECATGKKFVQYWLHCAFLNIDSTKISKSLNNAITLKELFDHGFTGDDYRYWLLTAHYRSPINFSWEALKASKQALSKLKRYVYEDYKQVLGKVSSEYLERFESFLANDLDTPSVIALVWELVKDTSIDNKVKCATLHEIDKVLDIGLSDDFEDGIKTLGIVAHEDVPSDIQELINKREAARIAQNWMEADFLRDALSLKGYSIEDTAYGPKITKSN